MSNQQSTIVTDLDGTLLHTDMLLESMLALLKRNFLYVLVFPFWLMSGRAVLKSKIAERVDLDVTSLPYREDLIAYLTRESVSPEGST